MPKKILFVLHEDSQTGAPNALLSFLKYINENYKNEFIIDIYVLNYFGGIEKELKEICRNFYINKKKKTFFGKLFKFSNPTIFNLQLLNKYDLIYGNTILTLNHLSKLKQKYNNVKTLLFVHESKYLTNIYLDKEKASLQFKHIDRVFTVSKSLVDNLINNYDISINKITIVNPAIQEENFSKNPEFVNQFKNNELLFVTIGHPNLTKGTELIPQIANTLRKRNPLLKFKIIIVGVLNNNEYLKAIQLDIKKLHLENYIELIPHTTTPLNYLDIADGYIIPSREDSFSLMAVQAARFKKPIIMFKNAVGVSEILDDECAFFSDYLDTTDFVLQMETIYNNPELSKQKANLALDKYNNILNPKKCNEAHYQQLKTIF